MPSNEPVITIVAQYAPDLPGDVVMVHRESRLKLALVSFTNCTASILVLQKRVIL